MILLWHDKQSIWYYYDMINNQYDTTDMINNQYDTTMTW